MLCADEIKSTPWVDLNTAYLWDQLVSDHEGAAG